MLKMADDRVNRDTRREVIETCERLSSQVEQLSQAISTQNESENRLPPPQPRFRNVEEEVFTVFGRGGGARERARSRANGAGTNGNGMTAPVFNLRRNFCGSSRSRSWSAARPRRPKSSETGPFLCDAFLLGYTVCHFTS